MRSKDEIRAEIQRLESEHLVLVNERTRLSQRLSDIQFLMDPITTQLSALREELSHARS